MYNKLNNIKIHIEHKTSTYTYLTDKFKWEVLNSVRACSYSIYLVMY